MVKTSYITILATCFLTTHVFANTWIHKVDKVKYFPWVATLSFGPMWQQAGKTQTFYLDDHIVKTYKANSTASSFAQGELFLGAYKTLANQSQGLLRGQFGLAWAFTTNTNLSGIIWDSANPAFNNYSYTYQVRHTHIAAKAKFLFDQGYWVTPWISGSIGLGFNTAQSFTNTPLICEAVQNPNFASKTVAALTYSAGIGIQRDFGKGWSLGFGYEFVNWGKNELGRAAGQTMNTGIKLNQFYTNGFLLTITYYGNYNVVTLPPPPPPPSKHVIIQDDKADYRSMERHEQPADSGAWL